MDAEKDKKLVIKKNRTQTAQKRSVHILRILNQFRHEGISRPKVAFYLKNKETTIIRTWNNLKNNGLIEKLSYGLWTISELGIDFLKKNRTLAHYVCATHPIRIEHYRIKMPIIKDNPHIAWEKEVPDGLGRWLRKYHKLKAENITIEKTPINIILHVKQTFFDPEPRIFKAKLQNFTDTIKDKAYEFLLVKKGIIVNKNGSIISQEIESEKPEQDNKVKPSIKQTMKLGRKAKSVLGELDQEAKAYLERSYGTTEIGTNDLDYEENLLLMPEKIANMEKAQKIFTDSLSLYNQNIELHLKAIQDIRTGISELVKTMQEFRDEIRKRGDKNGI